MSSSSSYPYVVTVLKQQDTHFPTPRARTIHLHGQKHVLKEHTGTLIFRSRLLAPISPRTRFNVKISSSLFRTSLLLRLRNWEVAYMSAHHAARERPTTFEHTYALHALPLPRFHVSGGDPVFFVYLMSAVLLTGRGFETAEEGSGEKIRIGVIVLKYSRCDLPS